jgi:hypothetical protein
MIKKLSLPFLALSLLLFLASTAQADFTGASKNISNSALDSKFPKICHFPDSSVVLAVWVETNGTDDFLYFSRSTDGGGTWWAPTALTESFGQILSHGEDENDNRAFSVAVNDDGCAHIVMQWRANASFDFEIYYMRMHDQGEAYDYWRQLTNNSSSSLFPDVAARGDYVHVAYEDDWAGNYEIMYKRIAGGGAGAVDQTRRLTFSAGYSNHPRIGVSQLGDFVGIAYEEISGGASNIFYKRIDSYGAGPYQTRQLTFGTDVSTWNALPYLAFGTNDFPNYIYLAYLGYWPGNAEVMYKTIGDYGLGSASTARLTYSATTSIPNSIAWGLSYTPPYYTVHVALHDNWPGNNDVMYRKLVPMSLGFTGQRVSWGTGDSSCATIAASGSWAYIAWMDNTSGNYEILVKYGY